MAKGKYKRKRLRRQRRASLIQDSGLSERVIRILVGHGINTLYELDMISDDVLSAMPRIGEKALKEIHAAQMHMISQAPKERK